MSWHKSDSLERASLWNSRLKKPHKVHWYCVGNRVTWRVKVANQWAQMKGTFWGCYILLNENQQLKFFKSDNYFLLGDCTLESVCWFALLLGSFDGSTKCLCFVIGVNLFFSTGFLIALHYTITNCITIVMKFTVITIIHFVRHFASIE